MKKSKTALRVSARAARTRLGNGFWETERDKRGTLAAANLTSYLSHVRQAVSNERDAAEDHFYEKVRSILCTNPYASPLAQILDRTQMQTLTDAERERYVFETSSRVQKCVERFRGECEIGLVAVP